MRTFANTIFHQGLSFWGLSPSSISAISNTKILDVTIKPSATEEEYKRVISFIKRGGYEDMIFTEAQNTRYYPEGTLLAHALGFVGSDNQGLFGLEYYYDDLLRGEDGYYVYAKDASGNTLDTEYSDYVEATDGYSLVTTVDSYIQGELEEIIDTEDDSGVNEIRARNRRLQEQLLRDAEEIEKQASIQNDMDDLFANVKKMVDSGNIPDDIKQMMNNLHLRTRSSVCCFWFSHKRSFGPTHTRIKKNRLYMIYSLFDVGLH